MCGVVSEEPFSSNYTGTLLCVVLCAHAGKFAQKKMRSGSPVRREQMGSTAVVAAAVVAIEEATTAYIPTYNQNELPPLREHLLRSCGWLIFAVAHPASLEATYICFRLLINGVGSPHKKYDNPTPHSMTPHLMRAPLFSPSFG